MEIASKQQTITSMIGVNKDLEIIDQIRRHAVTNQQNELGPHYMFGCDPGFENLAIAYASVYGNEDNDVLHIFIHKDRTFDTSLCKVNEASIETVGDNVQKILWKAFPCKRSLGRALCLLEAQYYTPKVNAYIGSKLVQLNQALYCILKAEYGCNVLNLSSSAVKRSLNIQGDSKNKDKLRDCVKKFIGEAELKKFGREITHHELDAIALIHYHASQKWPEKWLVYHVVGKDVMQKLSMFHYTDPKDSQATEEHFEDYF